MSQLSSSARKSIALLLTLFPVVILAQPPEVEWERIYGDSGLETFNSVQETHNWGFIMGGMSSWNHEPAPNAWIVNTAFDGQESWSRFYGASDGLDIFRNVLQVDDMGFVACGYYGTFSRAVFLKTNAAGDSIGGFAVEEPGWNALLDVQRTIDDGFILAGFSQLYDITDGDIWLVRTDADGDSVWNRYYGGQDYEWCGTVIAEEDGCFILAGETSSYGSGEVDILLIKTSDAGNQIWMRTFGGPDLDGCSAACKTSDGGFLLAGYTQSFAAGDRSFWIVKTNAQGDSLWSRTFGGFNAWCYDVCSLDDGGFLLVGDSYIPEIEDHLALIIRTNSEGDSLWGMTLSGVGGATIRSVQQTHDRGFILAGMTWERGVEGLHGYLAKLEPEPTNAGQPEPLLPQSYALHQNYPNPFNPSTRIAFDLPENSHVLLQIFDISGRWEATIADGTFPPGNHSLSFDGSALPSGIYFYRMQAGDFCRCRKMALVK